MSAPSISPADVEQRVDQLLSKLTADEKIKLIAGVDSFYTNAIASLKLPRLKMSDGPMGSRNDGTSTAFPAGALLASTWDPAIAQQEGVGIGRDCRARGDNFILGPRHEHLPRADERPEFRVLRGGPVPRGQIAVGYIQGVQSQGVAACAKHFAANNQETDRTTIDEKIDERTLREIYLPAFEAAVKQGHVRSVMSAYNKVNGDWITANTGLQNDVLKRDWKFDGLLMSDWGAVHEAIGPLNDGLDLEMPGPDNWKPAVVSQLLQDGKVSQATLDDKVRRLLRVTLDMGWMDRPQKDPAIALDDPQSNDTALAVAREGIVLLKNDGNLLPLDRAKVKTIAVLGPNADRFVGGLGSGKVDPAHYVSILDGLKTVAGSNVKVVAIPYHGESANLSPLARSSVYDGALKAEYFDNPTLSGAPAITRDEKDVDHNWQWNLPIQGLHSWSFSARWTGRITPTKDATYHFATRSDDGSRVMLDGKMILDNWSDHEPKTVSANIDLKADQTHDLTVEYYNAGGGANCWFGYEVAGPLLSDDEKATITGADAAVVCVGTDDTEGADRGYSLESAQNDLIRQTAALNPHTAVILNSGGNVAMRDWIGNVPALIDGFYTGQAQGTALAEVIFGDVNPSGHLPDTFEQDWPDSPAYGHYPGENGHVSYDEGIYVGYRWFDKKKIEPRFCFGHGLSYTTFKMDHLVVHADGQPNTATVSVDVTNTGSRAGATVAQLYVRPPAGDIDRPEQELKGFSRVDLAAGQTKTVTMALHPRSFAYWDTATHNWKAPGGQYGLAVGSSSRDIACTGSVTVK